MALVIVKEAENIWKKIAKGPAEGNSNFELNIHKKLLEFFQVGDYYYYIFNVSTSQFDFVSSEMSAVLGYAPTEIDVPFFLSIIHTDDQPWFLNFENKVGEFFATLTEEQVVNYKVRYDYRIRKKEWDYIRILQQVITIEHTKDNGVLKTLEYIPTFHILKWKANPYYLFIGLNGEPSYVGVQVDEIFVTNDIKLTRREKEILLLLVKGSSSEKISQELFISKMTVNTHRKNIMRKTNSTNTGQLVSNAVRHGWV